MEDQNRCDFNEELQKDKFDQSLSLYFMSLSLFISVLCQSAAHHVTLTELVWMLIFDRYSDTRIFNRFSWIIIMVLSEKYYTVELNTVTVYEF